MRTQEKKPSNCRVIIKDFELLHDNVYWVYCTDIDKLSPCEFELHFSSENIMDRLSDAMRWKKVIALSDLYRW